MHLSSNTSPYRGAVCAKGQEEMVDLGSSMHLDSALVGELAERIGDARKLYGNDSPYVIGLITAFEWIAQGVDGGEDLKRDLLSHIVDGDSPAPRPVREAGKVGLLPRWTTWMPVPLHRNAVR